MLGILEAYGIPPRIVRTIQTTYTGTTAKAVTADGEREAFEIHAGVL